MRPQQLDLHKHHHHPMIAADGKDSVEARREPASALESLPPPVKPLQISLNGESAAKPEAKADGRGNWREHRRAAHPHTARRGEPPTDTAGRLRVLRLSCYAGAKRAGEARAYLRPQPRSFSGHRFGHSFARTECEQTFANGTKIAEFSRIVRRSTSFGTRGSQVQILPLRPTESTTSTSRLTPPIVVRTDMRDETRCAHREGSRPPAPAPHKREGPTRWHRAGLQTRSAATWKSMTIARH